MTDGVVAALVRRSRAAAPSISKTWQDQVELALMRSGEHDVARAYVLYAPSTWKNAAAEGSAGRLRRRRRAATARH